MISDKSIENLMYYYNSWSKIQINEQNYLNIILNILKTSKNALKLRTRKVSFVQSVNNRTDLQRILNK